MLRTTSSFPLWERCLVRCAACLLALALALAGCGGLESQLADVRALQEAGDFAGSIEPLRDVLAQDPDHTEANYLLGVALVQTRQPTAAVWPLKKAASDDDYVVAANMLLASTLLANSSFEEAIAATERVLEREPEHLAALQLRAHAHTGTGDFEAALADAERYLEIEPTAYPGLVLKASALTALERTGEAEKTYEELVDVLEASGEPGMASRGCIAMANFYKETGSEKLDEMVADCASRFPSDATVLEVAAQHYDDRGEPERVDALLRQAVEEAPDDFALRDRLATRLAGRGKDEEALAVLTETTELFDTPQAWERLARHYIDRREYEAGREALDEALARVDQPPERMLFLRAEVLAASGEVDAARQVAAGLKEASYRDMVEGRIALQEGRDAEALEALEAALLRWPNNAFGRSMAGQAAERLGRPSDAIEHYVAAARSDESATDSALAAARLYYATGEFEKAIGMARKHVKSRDAKSVDALRIAVRCATALGRYDEARENVEQLSSLPGGTLPAHVELAGLERRARGRTQSLAVIERSGLDLTDPANATALHSAVDDLLALGRLEDAETRLERALAVHPDRAEWLEMRALVRLAQGRPDEARVSAERAIELEPGSGSALTALGRIARAEGRPDEAIELFDRAAGTEAPDAEAGYLAAQTLLESGRTDEAIERLREVVARHPENAYAANDLAWQLAQRQQELPFALELAERAVKLEPRPEILDTLGWVQLHSGDAAGAVATLESALTRQPDSPSVRYRYALALEAVGRSGEARAALERSLARGSFPEVEAARDQLAKLEAAQGGRP